MTPGKASDEGSTDQGQNRPRTKPPPPAGQGLPSDAGRAAISSQERSAPMMPGPEIVLTPEERPPPERWIRTSTTKQRLAQRAGFLLAAAEGEATTHIAKWMGVRPAR